MTIKDNASFDDICKTIMETHASKQSSYSSEPVAELPLDVWLAQIQIKATRAKYAVNTEKVIDELVDTAVYAILALEKMHHIIEEE